MWILLIFDHSKSRFYREAKKEKDARDRKTLERERKKRRTSLLEISSQMLANCQGELKSRLNITPGRKQAM